MSVLRGMTMDNKCCGGTVELVIESRGVVNVVGGGGKQWASGIMECHSEILGVRGLGRCGGGRPVVASVLRGHTQHRQEY